MAQFTKMKTPFDDDTECFSDQLPRLSWALDLAHPCSRGRVISYEIPEINRWEIEMKIKGRTIEPPTETMVYSRMYPSWETGIMMAMEEALARICGMYVQEISEMDNSFHQFGRRNSDGWALSTPGLREGLPWTEIQLEDMEGYAFNMELMLHNEMDATDDTTYQLQEKDEKIEQLENTIQKLKEKNQSLEATNDKLAFKTEDLAVQIAALQGQCAYLNQYLMKFDSWPTKKKTLLAIEESTPEAPKMTPRSKWCPRLMKERLPYERRCC
jgi:hypothetical protein